MIVKESIPFFGIYEYEDVEEVFAQNVREVSSDSSKDDCKEGDEGL